MPEHLKSSVDLLHRVFPDGVTEEDYPALLVALHEYYAEENLRLAVAALTGLDPVVVVNDWAAAMGRHRPDSGKVGVMERQLRQIHFYDLP